MRVVSLFKHVINITPSVYAKFNKRGVIVTLTVFSLIITKYSFRKILLHAERHARYFSINRLMEDSHAILMLISGCH